MSCIANDKLSKVVPFPKFSHIYIMFMCLWTKKKFESYFSDRLTFSNIRGRTSRRIYRLVLRGKGHCML